MCVQYHMLKKIGVGRSEIIERHAKRVLRVILINLNANFSIF